MLEESLKMIADGGNMVVGPWESGWGRGGGRAAVAPPGAAAARRTPGMLLVGLILIRCLIVDSKAYDE